MLNLAQCPTHETLRLFLDGRLVQDEAQSVESHLATCSSCAAVLSQVDPSRQAVPAQDTPLEGFNVRELVARFKALQPSAGPLDDSWSKNAGIDEYATAPAGATPPLAEATQATPRDGSTLKVRCPTCQNPNQLRDGYKDDVLCPGCGSSFRIRESRFTETSAPMKSLGKFQLLERLGLGGFGAVWKARDTELDRIVALKIPHTGLLTEKEELERFQREARAAAQLRHPHVVTVHEVATLNGLPVIVADFAPGVPLKDFLEVRGLTFRQSAALVKRVAEALQYAHSMGVVHRDIKPANLMLVPDTSRAGSASDVSDGETPDDLADVGKPMILDFGLALRDAVETTMTVDGQLLGTPAYMSPEQARGQGHQADARSDVYSLGVVLYELLAGGLPFRGSRHMLIHQVIHDEPTPPRKLNDKVPRDLQNICLKCLEKEPAQRYASAAALADDLGRYIGGQPVLARPIGMVERTWRWCRRNRAVASLLAVLGFVLTAGITSLAIAAAWLAAANESERDKSHSLHTANELLADKTRTLETANADLVAEQAKVLQEQAKVQRVLAESFLQSGVEDCLNHEPGLGLSSLLAAYEAARNDPELRHSIRLLLAGWERGFATRFIDDKEMEAVAFHPTSDLVMTASRATVHFWDRKTGLHQGKPVVPGGRVWSAAFSPKGHLFATGDDKRGAILWNVETGEMWGSPMIHPRPARVRTLAFSPDGKILATGCGDSLLRLADVVPQTPMGDARLWDVDTQKPIGEPMPHGKEVLCLAIRPDGKILVTGCDDKLLRFWDMATQKPVGKPIPHPNGVWTVSYSPDGKYLFTGDWGDKTNGGVGRLYDANTLELIHDRIRHKKGILASVFTADSQQIFVGSRDASAQFWEVKSGLPLGQKYESLRSIPSVAISPDPVAWQSDPSKPHAKEFMTCSRDCVARLFRDSTLRPVGPVFRHAKGIAALAISPDGTRLATASKDGLARVWDIAKGTQVGRDMKHNGPVNALAFSSSGQILITGSEDKMIRQWSVDNGEPASKPIPLASPITCLVRSPDRPWVLVGGRKDRTVQWVDLDAGQPIKNPLRYADDVGAILITANGNRFVTASDDTMRISEVDNGLTVGKTMEHTDRVLAIAMDRAGKLLVSSSADNSVRLWNFSDQALLQHMKGHEHDVYSVAISSDGRIVLSGGGPDDRTTRLWDAATGKQIAEAQKHDSAVNAVAFLPDGSLYAVAHESGFVDFWKTPRPVPDEPRRIGAWIRSRTLWTREGIGHRRLPPAEWSQSLKTLADLGGPFPAWDQE